MEGVGAGVTAARAPQMCVSYLKCTSQLCCTQIRRGGSYRREDRWVEIPKLRGSGQAILARGGATTCLFPAAVSTYPWLRLNWRNCRVEACLVVQELLLRCW